MRDDLDPLGCLLRHVEDAIAAVEKAAGFVCEVIEARVAAGLDTGGLETRLVVADENLGDLHAVRRQLLALHAAHDGRPVLRLVG
jgi:hypothetical protein